METKEKKVSMYRVCLEYTPDTHNYQLDLDFYIKITSVTNRYTITHKLNPITNLYNTYIHFSTCKDIYELLKLFGNEFNISTKLIGERKLKNDTNDFNNEK